MKHKTWRLRVLSGLLTVVMLLALAPAALAANEDKCPVCKQPLEYEVLKEATCLQEGIYEYWCANKDCTENEAYLKSGEGELRKVGLDMDNHDPSTAVYTDNGDGTHDVSCAAETHRAPVTVKGEKHTFKNGVCVNCLAVDYSSLALSTPAAIEQYISLNDTTARLSVGDVTITAGSADITSEYNISYVWYYNVDKVGDSKTYTPPASVTGTEGTYQFVCMVMAVPRNNPSLDILTQSCRVTVRVEDLVTAYATVGAEEEYITFSETSSRMPMGVEEQIYEAVYSRSNGRPYYVKFKQPAQSELGAMESSFVAGREYYFYDMWENSESLRLSELTFLPGGQGETGSYTLFFSAYDDRGKEFPGVVTILVEKYAGNMDVTYSVEKGGAVTFDTADFESFWLDRFSSGQLERVNFTRLPSSSEGMFYINWANGSGTRVKSGDYFYAAPRSSQFGLDEVSFVPANGFTGYIVVPFEAYGDNNRSKKTTRTGNLYLFVSDGKVSDVSCIMQTSSTYPFNEADFLTVYQAAGGAGTGFYIQLLDVPASGSLYTGYNTATGNGIRLTASTIKDRPFYYNNSWGDLIGDITYVPGAVQAESVPYIAYDSQGRPLYAGSIRFSLLEDPEVKYECSSDGIAFQAKDFTSFSGVDIKISNVTFKIPSSTSGTLYYDRTADNPGIMITMDTPRYYLTAPENITTARLLDKLTFVPTQGYSGLVTIPFTAYDDASGKVEGTVKITVASSTSAPGTTPGGTANNPADPSTSPTPAAPVTFPDVLNTPGNEWLYKPVTDLATAGIISGFEDGTFRPGEAITGGQVLKLIMMSVGYPNMSVSSADWSRPFMEQALKDGLLNDEIGLDKRLSRYAIAEIAAKALKLPAPKGTESPFIDMEMSHSSAPYVLALYEAGIVKGSGTPDQLKYQGTYAITRGEMAAIIWRMYNYQNYGVAEP